MSQYTCKQHMSGVLHEIDFWTQENRSFQIMLLFLTNYRTKMFIQVAAIGCDKILCVSYLPCICCIWSQGNTNAILQICPTLTVYLSLQHYSLLRQHFSLEPYSFFWSLLPLFEDPLQIPLRQKILLID
jgi:hypothetical protein